jgi:hypothetical protein
LQFDAASRKFLHADIFGWGKKIQLLLGIPTVKAGAELIE